MCGVIITLLAASLWLDVIFTGHCPVFGLCFSPQIKMCSVILLGMVRCQLDQEEALEQW